ncbi:MAG: DUF47 family protein, partial [Clostridiales bacterium]|nr:DUF47 family protein [Clostridiales bacterium]
MPAKKDNDYFEMFVSLAKYPVQASEKLLSVLKNFKIENIQKNLDEIHLIERAADDEKHHLVAKLAKEFISPFDREDIMHIADTIDDVTDALDDILLRIYMYRLTSIRSDALPFAETVHACCKKMLVVIAEFKNYHKSDKLHSGIIEMNQLEEM